MVPAFNRTAGARPGPIFRELPVLMVRLEPEPTFKLPMLLRPEMSSTAAAAGVGSMTTSSVEPGVELGAQFPGWLQFVASVTPVQLRVPAQRELPVRVKARVTARNPRRAFAPGWKFDFIASSGIVLAGEDLILQIVASLADAKAL
jgi:hypothetical protein